MLQWCCARFVARHKYIVGVKTCTRVALCLNNFVAATKGCSLPQQLYCNTWLNVSPTEYEDEEVLEGDTSPLKEESKAVQTVIPVSLKD